jgi:hypothetical protein
MFGYATSACWQTENVKTLSPYPVRSSETLKPKPNNTTGKRHGRNNSLGSVGSMSPSVPSVRKEECVEWNFYCLIDATAPNWRDISMNHAITNGMVSCENNILFRHGPLLPKITPPHSFHPFVYRFGKDMDARNEPVPLQNDPQSSLSPPLSIEKTKKI